MLEAERLSDEGLPVTLAQLAQRLGVQVPSLYKHVGGLDALRALVATRAKDEFANALAAATVGRSRAAAVDAACRAYREWAADHPGRYQATLRAPDPDDAAEVAASARAVEVITAILAGYGLAGDDAIDATRALRATLHGFASLEASGGFGLPGTDRSFDRLVAGLERMIASWGSDTI